jgi:SHS2 domain-containing protein
MKYTLIDHTADIGLNVFGKDPTELFSTAARALFDIMIDASRVRATQSLILRVEGLDWSDLMVNWLREILYLWSGSDLLVHAANIREIGPQGLVADIIVDPFDPFRHSVTTEIKAVTYHQIEVKQQLAGWEAKIILDV